MLDRIPSAFDTKKFADGTGTLENIYLNAGQHTRFFIMIFFAYRMPYFHSIRKYFSMTEGINLSVSDYSAF
jgi:hypothetical protein